MKRWVLPLLTLLGLGVMLLAPTALLLPLRERALTLIHLPKKGNNPQDAWQTEKQRLETLNRQLTELYHHELFLNSSLAYLSQLSDSPDAYAMRRLSALQKQLERLLLATPAHLIAIDRNDWQQGCWIDLGERDNRAYEKTVIAKNSPVLWHNVLIGVVELVGEAKAWVRLLCDSRLTPSVRSVRGSMQLRQVELSLEFALRQLQSSQTVDESFCSQLSDLLSRLQLPLRGKHLAKGYLKAVEPSFWSRSSKEFDGWGFNYDFADEEGEARDLRSGSGGSQEPPLLHVGDLLVTTGLDGLFPPDLMVAEVTKIDPLQEGATSYHLRAKPCISIEEVDLLFVLPPVSQ